MTGEQRQVSAWAVAGLVLGILSVLLIPIGKEGLGIFAAICGHAGLSDAKHKGRTGRGMAIAGLILGYLAVLVVILRVVREN